jgi:hypothetical protein
LELFLTVTGLTVLDFHLLVRIKVFNSVQMNQTAFVFRRYENASLRYTGIESDDGLLTRLYDTVVAKDGRFVCEIADQQANASGGRRAATLLNRSVERLLSLKFGVNKGQKQAL